MTIIKNTLAGVSAAMLVASPVMAQVQADRTAAPADGEQLFGGNLLLSLLAVAAVVAGIVVIADDDDEPVSP